ncbi:nuclease-related domain-containing protein [Metabacillus endolithicus]|uniref:Nuclease-related domain-containing protein n=1 Tax=Metabacillus endolithicus TaxID=1535204 RepID=A0ABW5BVT8_9BACI|nr:nuclease-related domain-containing protein [Metabacillus endolithicus]UPG64860.1 NERD domain-containing protein [Metabacillus endolithicus]
MAQIIKLFDYISRYELDAYRYPSQFIRLKKQQWEKVFQAWENNMFHTVMKVSETPDNQREEEDEKSTFIKKFKKRFSKVEQEQQMIKPLVNDSALDDDELQFQFTTIPKTHEDLKHLFLDYIFRFQIRWASSTIREKSSVDHAIYRDQLLPYFVKRLPDHYLLLYRPVFKLKNAPVELDIILIGTTEIYCLTIVEQLPETVFIGSKEKFWTARRGEAERKLLNPVLSLNRTGTVVKKLIRSQDIDISVKKLIISRNGYVDYPFAPHDITILDKRNYEEWFQRLRTSSAPLKHTQLKAAQVLLSHCLTNSFNRSEWNETT